MNQDQYFGEEGDECEECEGTCTESAEEDLSEEGELEKRIELLERAFSYRKPTLTSDWVKEPVCAAGGKVTFCRWVTVGAGLPREHQECRNKKYILKKETTWEELYEVWRSVNYKNYDEIYGIKVNQS